MPKNKTRQAGARAGITFHTHLNVRSLKVCIALCLFVFPVTAQERWTYASLGDSIAFGLYAPTSQNFTSVYRDYIRADNRVDVKLYGLGVPGWTSGDLLNNLRSNFFMRVWVGEAKVVTWSVGGNDLLSARDQYKAGTCGGPDNQECLRRAVQAFAVNWNAIIWELYGLRKPGETVFRTMDIYNPYVNVDRAADSWAADGCLNDYQVFNAYLDYTNLYIATSAQIYGIKFARVSHAFNGPNGAVDPGQSGLIAFDGLHPNSRGHAVIANLLRATNYAPLR